MQAYPGRDPVAEVMAGEISLRKFRLMVEHLPPGNPLEVARAGGWPESHLLAWNIEARIRELFALTVNINRQKGQPAFDPSYLPRPKTDEEEAAEQAQAVYDEQVEQELERVHPTR